jgi:hypothetical protein
MRDGVSNGVDGGSISIPTHICTDLNLALMAHGHSGNERPGGCAQVNFPSEAKEAVRAPWINCNCLGVFKMGTPDAPWELKLTMAGYRITPVLVFWT